MVLVDQMASAFVKQRSAVSHAPPALMCTDSPDAKSFALPRRHVLALEGVRRMVPVLVSPNSIAAC